MEKSKFTDSNVRNNTSKALSFDINNVNIQTGLNNEQVNESRSIFGINKLPAKPAVPLWKKILNEFKQLIMILLTVAALVSFITGVVSLATNGEKFEIISAFVESFVIASIIATNVFFSIRQENKTEKALESLKNLSSPTCKVIRNNQTMLIPSEDVVVGDILLLEAGEQIVADGILIEAINLKIEESILTGESIPVDKDANFISTNDMPLGDRKNMAYSGTTIINGRGILRVTHVGDKTEIGKIAKLLNQEEIELTPLQKQISKLSKYVGIAAICTCIITFIAYLFLSVNFNINSIDASIGLGSLNISISLAIAAIPEGLLAVTTIILSLAIQSMSKHNALIKRLPAVETLGSTSIICTDKTGTLTQNNMTVVKVWSLEHKHNISEDFKNYKSLFEYGSLCNDTKIYSEENNTQYIGDPTETSIVKQLPNINVNFDALNNEYSRLAEIPFDSDRKMMTVITKSDIPTSKYMIIVKGAPDRVVDRSTNLTDSDKDIIKSTIKTMANDALRTLAVAIRYIDEIPTDLSSENVEKNLNLIGIFGIIDPPRSEVKVAIQECKKAGIRTIMITGDHIDTASAIAKEIGILNPGELAISGIELEKMSDEELAKNIDKYSVYARVSPNDKIRIVKAWKANNKIVSMTGDGVNDAPSLKAADIGCAMGITGTDVAKNASDLVLMDDNFSTIVKTIRSGRVIMLNIKSALTLLLTANLMNLLSVLLTIFIFNLPLMASLQILWINVAAETILGFAVAKNNRHEDVMSFRPRDKNAFIIDKHMFIQIVLFGTLVSLFSIAAFYIGLQSVYGFQASFKNDLRNIEVNMSYDTQAMEANLFGSFLAFMTGGLCLSVNGICTRTSRSIFLENWNDSKYMIYAVIGASGLVMLVSYVPGLNTIFNMKCYGFKTSVANNYLWLNVLPYLFVIAFIAIYEIYKIIDHKFYNADGTLKSSIHHTQIVSSISK